MNDQSPNITAVEAIYPPSAAIADSAHVKRATYTEKYAASVADPEGFWAEEGKRLDWIKPYSKVKNTSFAYDDVSIKWFEDGQLNVAANCVDRHVASRGDQTAIIWEPDDPSDAAKHISYKELHAETCKMANILEDMGVRKGDRVVIYMPMVPQALFAMLACARLGAVHSVVFGGFAAHELATRINDAAAKMVISASCGIEPGRVVHYKPLLDEAIAQSAAKPDHCIILQRDIEPAALIPGRDIDYAEAVGAARAAGGSPRRASRSRALAPSVPGSGSGVTPSGASSAPRRATHAG